MNLGRAPFRLWLVFSLLFVVAVGGWYYPKIATDLRDARAIEDLGPNEKAVPGLAPMLPVECKNARGAEGVDWVRLKGPSCWYQMARFRALYPEYKDLSDDALTNRLYGEAARRRAWRKIERAVSIAFGGPLAILALGAALRRATAGSRRAA
jgi:hypothetical protein